MHRIYRPAWSKRAVSLAAILGLAATAVTGAIAASPAAANELDDVSLTSYVNPFIGTKDDGNTYPGAAMPFGMIQFSPDNGHSVGYEYGNDRIRGFSLVHISGVGCPLGGLFPVLPTTGELTTTNYSDYALGYSHDDEEASPGYYRVGLDSPHGTIDAELTVTDRTGVQRYTFPETDDAKVLLNPGQALNRVIDSTVQIIDDTTVETTITSRGFCQDTQPFTVHTRTTFDRPFESFGTWDGDDVSPESDSVDGERTGAYVTFDATEDQTVEAVTSLSYVDADGAVLNMDAEASTFDDARAAADEAWEERLRSIIVPLDDENEARVFYSALYRSFLAPNNGTDVDGRYRGWDRDIHQAEAGFTYYQTFSLWDTYRTQQQLLFLLAPEESRDMALSLVLQAEQYGWLPRWGYGPVETNIMTGDPGTAFLVSAYKQGLLEGHEERTYAVLRHNADNMPPAEHPANGRAGNPEYLEYGYVPHQPNESGQPGDYDLHHGASATLEYALSDALLATMARDLGYDDDAERYATRAQNYRAIFDVTTDNFRPRDRSGSFVGDPDPAWTEGFHEGTAAQHTWLVPQDVPGLIDLLGGVENTQDRLDYFFAYEELLEDPERTARELWVDGTYDYYGQDTYNPNNEPDLHAPFIYTWAEQPWKSTDVVRAARTLFTDGPDGVTGNDDLGTMSAWYIFGSIGIYPSISGDDAWTLFTPAFETVEMQLDEGYFGTSSLRMEAPGLTDESRYVQSVQLADGTNVENSYLRGSDLTDAGTITFNVGATPSDWATAEGSAPAALNDPVATPTRIMVTSDSPAIAVEPEGTAVLELEVIVQGEGLTSGTISVEGSDAVTATPESPTWEVESNGLPVSTSLPINLEAAEGYVSGRYPVTVTISSDEEQSITHTVIADIGAEPWLTEEHFNNVGIGDDGEDNADFDNMGNYLLRDLLEAQGFVQGGVNTVPGTDLVYVLPEAEPGEPDNVLANGQTIEVPALQQQVMSLSLIGSGNNGSPSGESTLTYADGTSDTVTVALSDWCTGDPVESNILVAKPGYRGEGTGRGEIGCGVYATEPIDIREDATLESITLPEAPNMHVFAIATEVANPEVISMQVEAAADEVEEGETVEFSASVEPADAAGEVVVTDRASGDEVGRATLVDGVAAITVTPEGAGAHEYTFGFVPDNATQFVAVSSAASVSLTVVAADGEDPTDPGEDPTDPVEDPTDPGDDPTEPGDENGEGLPETGLNGPFALAVIALLGLVIGGALTLRNSRRLRRQ